MKKRPAIAALLLAACLLCTTAFAAADLSALPTADPLTAEAFYLRQTQAAEAFGLFDAPSAIEYSTHVEDGILMARQPLDDQNLDGVIPNMPGEQRTVLAVIVMVDILVLPVQK